MEKNKCWGCFQEIEANLESGKWKKAKTPMKYWYEMFNAEKEFLKKKLLGVKPKTVLEIGAGTGRVIKILLKNSNAKIIATEKSKEMHKLVKKRFQKNKRVEIILSEKIPEDRKFDLVLCMMNTIGNQPNEAKIIKSSLKVSDKLIFSLYKKGYEQIRKEIYQSKGHEFIIKDNCFYFTDRWIGGTISKSYSKKDIKKICGNLGCKTKIFDLCKIAYLVELNKKN